MLLLNSPSPVILSSESTGLDRFSAKVIVIEDNIGEDRKAVAVNPKPGTQRTDNSALRNSKIWIWARAILLFLLQQWLVIGLAIACVLAALFPDVAAHGGVIKSQYSILYGAVVLIFFISGLQITREKLVNHLTSWRLHLITQVISFLIIPGIMLGLVKIIIAGGGLDHGIDISMLVGIIATSSLPTTISSNVIFTTAAGGDEAVAMIEVMIGNILGPFITPGLCFALLPKDRVFSPWLPVESDGLTALYRAVFMQIGLSVLLPLSFGQVIQWFFPQQSRKAVAKFYLPKVSTACLILLVWSTFSSCFASGALYEVSHVSIVCNVFINIGAYIFFTFLCFYACRPPVLCRRMSSAFKCILPQRLKEFECWRLLSKEETVAVCFCGAAKTTGLGIPMVSAMWGTVDQKILNSIQIPVVLYTTEQIFIAQIFVYFFKRWIDRTAQEDSILELGTLEDGGESAARSCQY